MMKKKTIIILSTVIFTILLLAILAYRIYLLSIDQSGFYDLKDVDLLLTIYTFFPEVCICITILSIYIREGWGLFFTGLAAALTVTSLGGELFIKIVKTVDVITPTKPPIACQPWLNIPVIIICIILFVVKFHIFSIPEEVNIKKKKKRIKLL